MAQDQFPQDEWSRDEQLDVERQEALAKEEAEVELQQQLLDERSSAEAFHRDAAPARIEAHRVFDAIWKSGQMKRKEAYRWMHDAMGLPWERTHIASLSAEECQRLVSLVKARAA